MVGNKVRLEVYDDETENIKVESTAFHQKDNVATDAGEDPKASDDYGKESSGVTQAMAYLEAQKASPHTLGIVLQQQLVKTGYIGVLV